MKIETREMTVQQQVYVANDGAEFVSEEECVDYEFRLLEESLKLYDSKYNKVDNVDSCYCADLTTEADVKSFMRACITYGITTEGIDEPGIYIYCSYDNWVNIDKVISHIRGEKKDEI